jgi:hypothetical protein
MGFIKRLKFWKKRHNVSTKYRDINCKMRICYWQCSRLYVNSTHTSSTCEHARKFMSNDIKIPIWRIRLCRHVHHGNNLQRISRGNTENWNSFGTYINEHGLFHNLMAVSILFTQLCRHFLLRQCYHSYLSDTSLSLQTQSLIRFVLHNFNIKSPWPKSI